MVGADLDREALRSLALVAQLSVALAVPFIEGRPYGDATSPLAGIAFGGAAQLPRLPGTPRPPPQHLRAPRTELFIAADVGVVIPTGDVQNGSLDLGLAFATRAKEVVMSLSAAAAYDSRTP